MDKPTKLDKVLDVLSFGAAHSAQSGELTGQREKPTLPVGVSVLITNEQGQLLLGKRINNSAAGMYSTPGGRIERNEDMFQCAIRETREETGVDLERDSLQVIGFKEHFRFGNHYFMFYLHAPNVSGEIKNREPEKCEGWTWLDLAKIPQPCTEPEDILDLLAHPGDGKERELKDEARQQRDWLIAKCGEIGVQVNVLIGAPLTQVYQLKNERAEKAEAKLAALAAPQSAPLQPRWEEFLTFFTKWWADCDLIKLRASMNDPIWADGKHYGDCTKQPMTCNRCVLEDIEKQAQEFKPFFSAAPPRKTEHAEGQPGKVDVEGLARQIIQRVAKDAVLLAITRSSLEWDKDLEQTDEGVAADAVDVCIGDDMGCLDEEDATAENCTHIYVADLLRKHLSSPAQSGGGKEEPPNLCECTEDFTDGTKFCQNCGKERK